MKLVLFFNKTHDQVNTLCLCKSIFNSAAVVLQRNLKAQPYAWDSSWCVDLRIKFPPPLSDVSVLERDQLQFLQVNQGCTNTRSSAVFNWLMQLAGELKPIVYSGFTHNPGYVIHDVISQRTLLYVGSQIFLTVCTLYAQLHLELFLAHWPGPMFLSQKRNRRKKQQQQTTGDNSKHPCWLALVWGG